MGCSALAAADQSVDAQALLPGGSVHAGAVELTAQLGGIGDLALVGDTYLASGFVGQVSNQAPTCASPATQTVHVNHEATVAIDAADADGDQVCFTLTTAPAHGSLAGNGPDFTYTPDAGYAGPDAFVLHIHDGADRSPDITVALDVRHHRTIRIRLTPDPNDLYAVEIEGGTQSATYTPGAGAEIKWLDTAIDHLLTWVFDGPG